MALPRQRERAGQVIESPTYRASRVRPVRVYWLCSFRKRWTISRLRLRGAPTWRANCQVLGFLDQRRVFGFLSPVTSSLLPAFPVALTVSSWNQTFTWLQEMDVLRRERHVFTQRRGSTHPRRIEPSRFVLPSTSPITRRAWQTWPHQPQSAGRTWAE
jgi:hypothetical protein